MLKEVNDDITKAWKPIRCHQPFFDGGKIHVASSRNYLVSLYNENLSFINWETGDRLCELFEEKPGEEDLLGGPSHDAVTCYCVHPKESFITICTGKNLLQLWSVGDIFSISATKPSTEVLQCIRSVRGHTMPVLSMAYDPTGSLVATGSADNSVRVWDMERGYCTHSFRDLHTDVVQRVRFHPVPNNLTLFSSSDDTTVRMFDLVDQKNTSVFREHMSLPSALAISDDGILLATGGRDKVLNFYDLARRVHLKTVLVMDSVEGLEFIASKDTTSGFYKISAAVSSGYVRVYMVRIAIGSVKGQPAIISFSCDASTQLSVASVGGGFHASMGTGVSHDADSITALYHLNDSNSLVAATADHTICVVRYSSKPTTSSNGAMSKKPVKASSGSGSSESTESITLAPDRQLVGSFDDILDIGYVPRPVAEISTMTGSDSHVSDLLAIVSNSPHVRLMDRQYRCQTTLVGHSDIVLAVDVSPDGNWIATSSKDQTVRMWRVADGRNVAIGEGHTDAVGAICLARRSNDWISSNSGSRSLFLVSGAGDKIVKKWTIPLLVLESVSSTDAGVPPVRLTNTHNVRGHEKDINTIAISPNDALVATGSQDKLVKLWKSADMTLMATLSGHKRGVWRVMFSPVDKCVASCSGDRTIRLWSVVDFACLRTFEGSTGSVLSVRFVNRGMQLVSGSADGLIRLWTIRTGECECILDNHTNKVWALAVPPEDLIHAAKHGQSSTGANQETTAIAGAVSDIQPAIASDDQSGGEEKSNSKLTFFSGGSDSRLVLWKDVTSQEEQARILELEKGLLMEQELQNDLRHKRYHKALKTALHIGHSNRVLGILQTILEDDDTSPIVADPKAVVTLFPTSAASLATGNSTLVERLDDYVREWSDEELEKVVTLMKDWNTNAKHAFVCSMLLGCLLRVVGVAKLSASRTVQAALPGLIAYTERHYQRVSRLVQATYLADYFSSLMQWLPAEQERPTAAVSSKRRTIAWSEPTAGEVDPGAKKRARGVTPSAPILFSSNEDSDDEVRMEKAQGGVDAPISDTKADRKSSKSSKKKKSSKA